MKLTDLEQGTPQDKCVKCGHIEDDHDGYGGMCDGLGWNASREVCPCQDFVATRRLSGTNGDTP